ncbi:hypothetical protein EDD35_7884 [Amycolatopsis thermoflava]|uniref:Uncharacterized protein n=1 Tax=Amycolatopsis thermoflava TaxID=84480 RepID=A0A3N2G664_9PSEU|nr:hypothetical protein EDD35_7884 [Amycolatopsis thermoflava]
MARPPARASRYPAPVTSEAGRRPGLGVRAGTGRRRRRCRGQRRGLGCRRSGGQGNHRRRRPGRGGGGRSRFRRSRRGTGRPSGFGVRPARRHGHQCRRPARQGALEDDRRRLRHRHRRAPQGDVHVRPGGRDPVPRTGRGRPDHRGRLPRRPAGQLRADQLRGRQSRHRRVRPYLGHGTAARERHRQRADPGRGHRDDRNHPGAEAVRRRVARRPGSTAVRPTGTGVRFTRRRRRPRRLPRLRRLGRRHRAGDRNRRRPAEPGRPLRAAFPRRRRPARRGE